MTSGEQSSQETAYNIAKRFGISYSSHEEPDQWQKMDNGTGLKTHRITVIFTLDTEPIGPWSSEQVALDHITHVIDEGYRFDGHWELVPAAYEAFPATETVQEADPESYPNTGPGS